MKKRSMHVPYMLTAFIIFFATFPAHAQFTATTLESGNLASGIAKDASGNIYVVRFNFSSGTTGGNGTGQLVKYTNGAGTPAVIYNGIPDEGDLRNDFATGLVVASNGDIYLITDNNDPHTEFGKIIKLTYNGGTSYTPSVWQTGTGTLGYYTALAMDASDNLYVVQYNFDADGNANEFGAYEVDEYAAGSAANSAPTRTLYDKLDEAELTSGAFNAVSTGLAVAPNGDVYVTTGFNLDQTIADAGSIYKLTKASGYSLSTISTGFQATGLSVSASGNLYALQATASRSGIGYSSDYGLYEYPNGTPTQSPVSVYTPLISYNKDLFPYGIAIINEDNIFVTDGQANGSANSVLRLTGSALPLTWLNFNVKKEQNTYEWDWSLAAELNIACYVPQYSLDGIHFTDAGKIATFNASHTYRFNKDLPVNGKVFFRIKELDIDGRTAFSAIKSLELSSSNSFSFYPNPVLSAIAVTWPYGDAESVHTVIVNSEGKIVMRQNRKMAFPIKIDLSGLAGGMYFIYCTDNNNHKSASLPLLKISK